MLSVAFHLFYFHLLVNPIQYRLKNQTYCGINGNNNTCGCHHPSANLYKSRFFYIQIYFK